MKLFRTLAVAATIALIGLCSGCATNASKVDLGQAFAVACPAVQTAIVQFELIDGTLVGNAEAAKADALLVKIQPSVEAACKAGATISTENTQDFAQTVLPALGQIAGTLPLPPAQLAQIQSALVVAEVAVGAVGVVEAQIHAAQAAKPSPASSSTVASSAK